MPSYLVSGAAGFLGFFLAKAISENVENKVYVVDNFIRGEDDRAYADLCARDNVVRIDLDLSNQADVLAKLPDQVDYVYHMAALNGTQNFYERPFEVVRCCTLPTLFLLEKYGPAGNVKRFVYAGTSEAYASTVTRFDWPVPTDEKVPLCIDDVTNERWSYGGSKMHGEIAVLMAGRHYGMDVSVIRFHNAYGPRMGDKHVIPDFLVRAQNGVLSLYGHENTRSFIYVDDAVAATLAVGSNAACVNEIVNIGGADEITMLDLARHMVEIGGFKGDIELFDAPSGSVNRRAPDVSKLKALTGFNAKWSLEDGLRKTMDFYLNGNL